LYFTLFVEVKQKVAWIANFSRPGGNADHVISGDWQFYCHDCFTSLARKSLTPEILSRILPGVNDYDVTARQRLGARWCQRQRRM
jgi:hypothetical protein